MKLTKKIVRQLVRYDPETGYLYWKKRSAKWFTSDRFSAQARANMWNGRWADKRAFNNINANGYYSGTLFSSTYDAHIIIWLYMDGKLPRKIDHDNGKILDNRWVNLKASDDFANARNRRMSKANTSGVNGVYKRPNGKWIALITIDGRLKSLGTFSSRKAAYKVRVQKQKELGYSDRHGKALS